MNLEQIDTSTTAGKAEVMRLAAEGRRAVWRVKGDSQWRNSPVEWNWTDHQYAIIAEPVGPEEVWIVHHEDGDKSLMSGKLAADEWVANDSADKVVRYIRADLAENREPSIPASVLRALADRWASDRGYEGSPVDDVRALVDQPTADLAGEVK